MAELRIDIIAALESAFPGLNQLDQLLWYRWGKRSASIIIADNYTTVLMGVVDDFNRRSRLLEFLQKACEDNPQHKQLGDVRDRVQSGEKLYDSEEMEEDEDGEVSDRGGTKTLVRPLRSTSQMLLAGLGERMTLFRYMNASKELHEILHQLYSSRERIRAAMTNRMEDPSRPLASDVVESMEDWIERAESWYGETEWTKKEPEWIGRMRQSLTILSDSDASKWEKAYERLTNFQTRVMSGLNKDIVDNAERLEGEELATLCQSVFECTDETVPRQAKLRREVQQFRNRCCKMATLVEAHNLCQEIENSLQEANGLSVFVADDLIEWTDAIEKFARLRELFPNSHQLRCTMDAAEVFAQAANSDEAATQYSTFKTCFDDFFHRTDQDLLDTCKLVYTSVDRLNDSLEEQLS